MTHSYLLIVKSGNHDTLGIVSVRIMIHEWPLASSSNLKLIVVQEEVTDIDEKQASILFLNHCIYWLRYKSIVEDCFCRMMDIF